MRYIATILLSLGMMVGIGVWLTPQYAHAQAQGSFDEICAAVEDPAKPKPDFCTSSGGDNPLYGPNGIITRGTQALVFIVAPISVIMIIIGGIKFAVSTGDSAGVKSAKDTILYALIGLAVSLLAQLIVIFVLNRIQ